MYLVTVCALFYDRFLGPRKLAGWNRIRVRMWNNIELGVLGGALGVWLWCGCVGNRKQQKSSSPPSHVEIKLSGSGAKFIFRIKDSSKKEPRRLGPHPQLLGPLPFCISINSFLSFSRCYIFKPSSASNLPFSGFLLHQCHDPILKESWTRPDAG